MNRVSIERIFSKIHFRTKYKKYSNELAGWSISYSSLNPNNREITADWFYDENKKNQKSQKSLERGLFLGSASRENLSYKNYRLTHKLGGLFLYLKSMPAIINFPTAISNINIVLNFRILEC